MTQLDRDPTALSDRDAFISNVLDICDAKLHASCFYIVLQRLKDQIFDWRGLLRKVFSSDMRTAETWNGCDIKQDPSKQTVELSGRKGDQHDQSKGSQKYERRL